MIENITDSDLVSDDTTAPMQ